MEDFEREQLLAWHNSDEFDKIIQYVDLLKEPTYDHLGFKAAALNNVRRFYEAIDVLNSIKKEGTNDALWHYRYGYSLISLQKFEEAEQYLLNSIALNEDFIDAYYLLSWLYEDIDNPVEKERVEKKLAEEDLSKLPDLVHDDFVTNQQFNQEYKLFEHLFVAEDMKQQLIAVYEQFINALEETVQTNTQILPLTLSLAQTVQQQFEQHQVVIFEELLDYLVGELTYILRWFDVEESYGLNALYLFSYVLIYDDKEDDLLPEHLMQFLVEAMQDNHQNICQLFYTVPKDKRTYAYYEWGIQAHLQQNQWQEALDLIKEVKQQGKHHDMWHYWYAAALTGLHHYEEAELYLKQAVTLDINNIKAWQLLETVYLIGLEDIKQANIVREKWEQILDNLTTERDEDDDE